VWHQGPRVNMIDMVVLSTRYHFFLGSSSEWNREVKRAGAGAVWGWVTDREVWPRVQFDLRLSIIRVKNVPCEIKKSNNSKKLNKKNWIFFLNFCFDLCRVLCSLAHGKGPIFAVCSAVWHTAKDRSLPCALQSDTRQRTDVRLSCGCRQTPFLCRASSRSTRQRPLPCGIYFAHGKGSFAVPNVAVRSSPCAGTRQSLCRVFFSLCRV
jgi:hypothetical protein